MTNQKHDCSTCRVGVDETSDDDCYDCVDSTENYSGWMPSYKELFERVKLAESVLSSDCQVYKNKYPIPLTGETKMPKIIWEKLPPNEFFFRELESGRKIRTSDWNETEFVYFKDGTLFDKNDECVMHKYNRERFVDVYIGFSGADVYIEKQKHLDLHELFEALSDGKKINASDWCTGEFLVYDKDGFLVNEIGEPYPIKDFIERFYRSPSLEIKK